MGMEDMEIDMKFWVNLRRSLWSEGITETLVFRLTAVAAEGITVDEESWLKFVAKCRDQGDYHYNGK